jgi:hypothetical protein
VSAVIAFEEEAVMQGLRNRLSVQLYLFLGLLTILLSAGLAAISFMAYGKEMGPHIFATIIGILGEAALVVLVLDRMANSQKLREWRFVGTVVSHGVAAWPPQARPKSAFGERATLRR